MSEVPTIPKHLSQIAQASFETAVEHLNSRKERPKKTLEEMRGLDDMKEWLQLLGHSVSPLVLHLMLA